MVDRVAGGGYAAAPMARHAKRLPNVRVLPMKGGGEEGVGSLRKSACRLGSAADFENLLATAADPRRTSPFQRADADRLHPL